jgi:hypothetical protein
VSFWIQVGLFIIPIAISITIFFAQGPYNGLWKYILPFIPLLLGAIGITVYRLALTVGRQKRALGIVRRIYRELISQRLNSWLIVRVLNEHGDIEFEREYELLLDKKNALITHSKYETMTARGECSPVPPPATISVSPNVRTTLTPVNYQRSKVLVNNMPHVCHTWRYVIDPPLRNRKDRLKYRYAIRVPGEEANAFKEEGSLFFVENRSLDLALSAMLIACSGYRIEILETFLEESDGTCKALDPACEPHLEAAASILRWAPPYLQTSRYVCRYRLSTALL